MMPALTRALAAAVLLTAAAAPGQDPYADAVVAFTPGEHAGFGADLLPDIVLGPPRGAGLQQGSLHVASLGNGGAITLRFELPLICNGEGPDFTVFENAFHSGGPDGPVFEEYGIVAVSQDGVNFVDLPYDAVTHAGLAGRRPVLSDVDNGIDALDPAVSGGDTFDLAPTGLAWAAYVRITDPGASIPDPGNLIPPGDNSGFDLDAIAALHACDPSAMGSATPTPTATPLGTGGSPTPAAVAGDLDGDGRLTPADLVQLVRELFDGDGDLASAAAGGEISSPPAADLGGDGRIGAADVAALRRRVTP
ncbi:MAG: dockerin type I domain-containing protein [Candidatus Binatia bacterium]